MVELDVLQTLLANPQFVAAIIAVIWNISGYIAALLKIKGLEKYELTKLGETLLLFEAVFTIMATVAGLPLSWTAVIAIAVVVIRSVKSAIDSNTAAKAAKK